MYNDTVSDFLTRLRNSSLSGKKVSKVRYSQLVAAIAEIFKKEGFIASIDRDGNEIDIVLNSECPLTHIKRISKPGIRRYVKSNQIPSPRSGFGMVILSTPKGVLTGQQAKKQKVGGELICEVW